MNLTLTHDNYHSREANLAYMSVSQYKQWRACPSTALAIHRGEWMTTPSDAMILGSYVDGKLLQPEKLAADMANNPDTYFTKQGKPRAFVEQGNQMAERARSDKVFTAAIAGDHQMIITFPLAGVTWKSMMDVVNHDTKTVCDLKTTRSLDYTEWSDASQSRLSWIEIYGYWTQMAVYRLAYKHAFKALPKHTLLAAVTKENPPDIGVYLFDNRQRLNYEIEQIKATMPTIMRYMDGSVPAPRCGKCDHCRLTKVIENIIPVESQITTTITEEQFAATV